MLGQLLQYQNTIGYLKILSFTFTEINLEDIRGAYRKSNTSILVPVLQQYFSQFCAQYSLQQNTIFRECIRLLEIVRSFLNYLLFGYTASFEWEIISNVICNLVCNLHRPNKMLWYTYVNIKHGNVKIRVHIFLFFAIINNIQCSSQK